jgi:hypothetical protein
MTAAKKIPARAPLDGETLTPAVRHTLARHALIVAVTGAAPISGSTIEHDKRSQAKALRDLCDAGWLSSPRAGEYGITCDLMPDAITALASEPTAPLPPWYDDRGERLALPCSPVMAIASGYGTYSKQTTDEVRAMLWRVLHPERFRWALVPSERAAYHGYARFPIPLDSNEPIAPQVRRLNAEWSSLTGSGSYPGGLDLVIADDSTILRHQQGRARALWKQHRGRTLLALARFGGYTKAEAADEADEADVDEIPSLGGGGFIRARTSESYDPKRSWEDEAQRQLTEADEAVARAQERRAALLKRYTKVAIANPGQRPYDAMRARYEQWIADYVIEQTGVDPRTLPETGGAS